MLIPTDRVGQFDVVVDDEVIASRGGNPFTRIVFGAGFPDPAAVVAEIEDRAEA